VSNYIQSTNFATKDALTSGDPLKIVKGTEINIEFVNIAVAVATKADLASPTFTGTPTLPSGTVATTQTFGNSSTLLSTTAFVQAAMAALHPVGSIYTSTSATNPGTSFGFGTWVAFGAGKVLIGDGGGYAAGATGGSADATLPSHTHTATTPNHSHSYQAHTDTNAQSIWYGSGSYTGYSGPVSNVTGQTTGAVAQTITVSTAGSSATNANLQPYVVVYMWNRTA
jgi:hypothetical protein